MELDKDNRLQTAEKIWGAVAHPIIAIGKQRGWKVGKTHRDLEDVVVQLGAELDAADGVPADADAAKQILFRLLLNVVNGMRDNFCRNDEDEDDIDYAAGDAAELISYLEPLLNTPPQPFTPRVPRDQSRLARLLGMPPPTKYDSKEQERKMRQAEYDRWFPLGKPDANGFSPNFGYRKPGTADDDNGAATAGSAPPFR